MHKNLATGCFFSALLFFFIFSVSVTSAYSVAPDTTIAKKDTTAAKEIVLEDIHIEAVVEKPSVTIIPKKIVTAIGDVPFKNRSFDKELKERPRILDEYSEELESAKRIEKLKKILAKESK